MSSNTQHSKQTSPINQSHSIEELNMKYESSFTYETSRITSKTKSPKKLKKSKVQQMALMINSKIPQIIKCYNKVAKYSTLINEFSPEPKPQPTVVFAKIKTKPRTRSTKSKAPVPTPKMKSLAKDGNKSSTCMGDENMNNKDAQRQKEVIEHVKKQSEIEEEKLNSTTGKLEKEAKAKLEAGKPKPMPRKKKSYASQINSATSIKIKSSAAEESESGLSSLPKTSSEDSQDEDFATSTTKSLENGYEFVKPIKPPRRKKLRKNNSNKKQESNQITSTDSETDSIQPKTKSKSYLASETNSAEEDSFVELDQSLMRIVNSPSKVKSAYTLTVNDLETSLQTPCSSLKFAKRNQTLQKFENCSITDQGFETESDSPQNRCSLTESEEPYSSPLSSTKNNFEFSTPIKNRDCHQSFAKTSSAKQQLFSPISKPLKNHRKYINDVQSKQVIKEDQTNTFTRTQQSFANASTLQLGEEVPKRSTAEYSQFWIKSGDFFMGFEINLIDSERLCLLYEIFSQTSCDTKDLHFGIDDQQFSVHGSWNIDNTSIRIPATKGYSHYWFSTGDLAIPFSGKLLTSHKIQRLFRVIKETVEETGILRFGVDEMEFSNVPEFWYQPTKFSEDSHYSMLVGLQSGEYNGLEGRSKYAWPHSKPLKTSDMDESLNESVRFVEIERGRLSFSTYACNYYDLESLHQNELPIHCNSEDILNVESFCSNYESEPLDQLFEDSSVQSSEPNLQNNAALENYKEVVV